MIFIVMAICIIMSGVFNSQMDTLEFRPQSAWSQGKWWQDKSSKFPWLIKGPFSFVQNGWHFCKAVDVFCMCIPFGILTAILFSIFWTWGFLIAIGFYIVKGSFWQIEYGNKFL